MPVINIEEDERPTRWNDLDEDEDYYDDDEEDYYDGDTELHSYSYTPPLQFKGIGPPYYGMEIEVTSPDRAIPLAKSLAGDLAWLKEDSSVDGFEMVTHPMAYDWAMQHFPWDMLPELRRAGCEAITDSNGIHVHVGRDGFGGPAHLYRWMKFVYRNQDDVTRIARRDSHWGAFSDVHKKGQAAHALKHGKPQAASRFSRRTYRPHYMFEGTEYGSAPYGGDAFRYLVDMDHNDYLMRPRHDGGTSGYYDRDGDWVDQPRTSRVPVNAEGVTPAPERPVTLLTSDDTTLSERYSAINTQNEDTLEVRVFASTLDPVAAKSALQLVDASVQYTRDLNAVKVIKDNGWEWPAFVSYLAGVGKYPDLERMNRDLGRVN